MILVWNRKEVHVSTSLDQFNAVCDILASNQIRYKHRVVNRNSANVSGSSRARTGTFGQNLNQSVTYYVYVHQNDYEQARSKVQKVK